MLWQKDEAGNALALAIATRYAAWATQTPAGKALHRSGVLFKAPRKVDPMHLVHLESETRHGIPTLKLAEDKLRAREAFHLTDQGMDLNHALDQANYCIFCHNQGKDSCSRASRKRTARSRRACSASPSPAARSRRRFPRCTR